MKASTKILWCQDKTRTHWMLEHQLRVDLRSKTSRRKESQLQRVWKCSRRWAKKPRKLMTILLALEALYLWKDRLLAAKSVVSMPQKIRMNRFRSSTKWCTCNQERHRLIQRQKQIYSARTHRNRFKLELRPLIEANYNRSSSFMRPLKTRSNCRHSSLCRSTSLEWQTFLMRDLSYQSQKSQAEYLRSATSVKRLSSL